MQLCFLSAVILRPVLSIQNPMRSFFRSALLALFALIFTASAEPQVGHRFEKEIAAYEAADKVSAQPQGAVVFTEASMHPTAVIWAR